MKPSARFTLPWYISAFAHGYSRRYQHRSDELGQREVAFALKALGLKKGARILDLCCGNGRHSRALANAGFKVVGVDLSAVLLDEARSQSKKLPIEYLCSDMRSIPLGDGSVDGVVNLFTSFGYFEDDAENQRVFDGIARVLKPGAPLLFDFFNRASTLATLEPRSMRFVSGTCLHERRWYDTRRGRLNKLTHSQHGTSRSVVLESVRAYAPRELEGMLSRAGLKPVARYGSLGGDAFDARASARCVLLARKA